MAPLLRLKQADLQGAVRGVAFQLCEGLGSVTRRSAQQQIGVLSATDRKVLRANGIRIGAENVFMPALLKPKVLRLRSLLWQANNQVSGCQLPAPGLVSAPRDQQTANEYYSAIGYRVIGDRIVRIDIVDRVALTLIRLARKGPFQMPSEISALLGMGNEQANEVAVALGFKKTGEEGLYSRVRRGQGPKPKQKHAKQRTRTNKKTRGSKTADPNSPFAQLADLRLPS